jgi:septum site-determining protein MinC
MQDTTAMFDFKAGHFTLPALLIREDDPDALDAFLAAQVARLPRFFDQAPIVIDLSGYPADQPLQSFPAIVGMIRGHGMIPVGVRGAAEPLEEQARLLELALMPELRQRRKAADSTPEKIDGKPAETAPARRTTIVDKPVRSGQRIYAQGGDLVLLAGVSSGAEVLADGHIHAYGPIRGRVLAGVCNDPDARIFCGDLGAELVAIAGRYQVNEDLPSRFMGRPVQISLQGDSLQFTSL